MRQRWRKGQEDRGKERKEKKQGNEERENSTDREQNRVSVSLFTLWSFIAVFKVHTSSIREAGPSQRPPSFCRPKSQSLPGN